MCQDLSVCLIHFGFFFSAGSVGGWSCVLPLTPVPSWTFLVVPVQPVLTLLLKFPVWITGLPSPDSIPASNRDVPPEPP
ncbi:hypothetical protein AMECASPLE_035892 [Ameca splendens]|uniref:Secreted protein n=1 Tax=Ameca splendens TaxID=208324 RepID=A0ABV1A3P4_9TELE